jgi:hypothetical protein
MYCPKCATQNADDARFCRSCGSDISLVPQAVSGSLAERLTAVEESRDGRRRRRHRDKWDRPPSIDRAVRGILLGLAFVFIAFAVRTWAPAGNIWWFWMFIPAAVNLADGIATSARLASDGKKRRDPQPFAPQQTYVPPPPRASVLPPRETGEVIPPPSVTEGTTRHLGVPVERKRGEG